MPATWWARAICRRQSPRTTPDALKGLPSVMLQKTSYGQGSPFLRGFTGFRTLAMVDGVRLNNSVFRDGPNQYWNTIDPWSIDRYEVVLGPASVLYGSDAVGGAVNALTLAPPEWTGQAVWERTLRYRTATADESHQVRAGLRGRASEQLGFVAGYTWKDFDDVEGGDDVGDQPQTGYDEMDYDLRADYAVAENTTLTLAHQHVDQEDAWRTHRTVYGIDWEGLKKGDDQVHAFDQRRTLTYLSLRSTDRGGAVDAYTVTLSRQVQSEDLDRLRVDNRRDLQGFDVTTWGASATLESGSSVGRWVYGADYYRDEVDSYSARYKADGSFNKKEIQGPVADDATYDLVGLFVQDTVDVGALAVTPGLRYTRAELQADKVADPVSGEATTRDDDWDTVVGSLRALLPMGDEGSALYAGVSQGFRAPNLSDLTRLDTARSTELETPVEDLDPERFVSWEIGGRVTGQRLSAEAAYYYTHIEDLIVRAPTGRTVDELLEVTKKNAGDGYVQGVELTVGYQLADAWRVRAMGTWMDGEVEAYPTSDPVKVKDDLSRVMPLTGQLSLRWQPKGVAYWAEVVVDAAEKADHLSADDARDTQRIPPGGTPAYTVFTVRGGLPVCDYLDLTLALENLADEDYRIHGSGVNEPGRQLVLTAQATF
jgi:hemoglobin/transferrin/lactoferrin receptor protein